MIEIQFKYDAIVPGECFREGWDVIKDQIWLLVTIYALTMIVNSILFPLSLICMGPLNCSVFYCVLTKMRGQRINFEMLSAGFKHFIPTMLIGIFFYVPVVIITIFQLLAFAILSLPYGIPFVVFLVFLFLCIAWNFALSFAYPLVIDYKLTAWEAIALSVNAARKNLGGIIHLSMYYSIFILIVIFLLMALFYILFAVSLVLLAGIIFMLALYIFSILASTISVAVSVIAYKQVFLDYTSTDKLGSTGLIGLGLD